MTRRNCSPLSGPPKQNDPERAGTHPDGSGYRPDPKSRTAQEIAWQIVCEEKMLIEALESGVAEWAPPPMPTR